MIERLLFAGIGGQGVQAMAKMIAESAIDEGYEVVYTSAYGGAQRGGASNANVIVSDKRIGAPMILEGEMTVVIAMDSSALKRYESYLAPGGLLIINTAMVKERPTRTDIETVYVDVVQLAKQLGNERVSNMVALGALLKKRPIIAPETLLSQLAVVFGEKRAHLLPVNRAAIELGAESV